LNPSAASCLEVKKSFFMKAPSWLHGEPGKQTALHP
jgi:hypothetical protein